MPSGPPSPRQVGDGLPIAVALLAVAMGLNLLEVLPLRLPSLDLDVRGLGVPPTAQAYLAGATFALAASPCSTPILATLLAYVSTTRDPVTGGWASGRAGGGRGWLVCWEREVAGRRGPVVGVTAHPRLFPPPPTLLLAGGALLFAYTLGYVLPLLAAAAFTGALQRLLAVRQASTWVTPASGVLLLAGGTYALLARLVPA